jgi:hypothetical protein
MFAVKHERSAVPETLDLDLAVHEHEARAVVEGN